MQTLPRFTQLRESYIGISHFLHSRLLTQRPQLALPVPSPGCRRLYSSSCQRAFRTNLARRSQSLHEAPIASTDSVPELTASEEPSRHTALGVFEKNLEHNIPLSSATSWNELSKQSNGKKVVMHGYLTSQRVASNDVRFATLVDPTLRQSTQLVILRRPSENVDIKEKQTSESTLDNKSSGVILEENRLEQTVLDAATKEQASETGTRAESPGAIDTGDDTDHATLVDAPEDGQRGPDRNVLDASHEPTSRSSTSSVTTKASDSRVWLSAPEIAPHTPVRVVGYVKEPNNKTKASSQSPNTFTDRYVGRVTKVSSAEVLAIEILPLNTMAQKVSPQNDAVLGPHQRHLQFRTSSALRHRIRNRSRAMALFRKGLFLQGFDEIETPLLFKSTPEGAREFIVPTRQKGLTYALPQSPQQYKQMLMASGFHRYFQFARCFRDEDMRADRQPEFTQLDLEMSFSSPKEVMELIETLMMQTILPALTPEWSKKIERDGKARQKLRLEFSTDQKPRRLNDGPVEPKGNGHNRPALQPLSFRIMTYHNAMTTYGSDKPDLRLPGRIYRVDHVVPQELRRMLTSLENPIVEMTKIHMSGSDPVRTRKFIASFMESPAALQYVQNPHGMPGVTIFDPSKPLNGLASFGHDIAARMEQQFKPTSGDVLVLQTRPNAPNSGSSTVLGNMRIDLYHSAAKTGLIPKLTGFEPVWIVDFPLFSLTNNTDEQNANGIKFCSTHHPFTAPKISLKQGSDLTKLLDDPLSVVGDHFDLVINGVEVGGGSRRIHYAPMQELILRDILRLKPEQLESFRHLLNALQDGCPPHTGFALGFDRLMAILEDVPSVKDVMAFPKSGNGVDQAVKSPAPLTPEQLKTYHLAIADCVSAEEPSKVSLKA